MSTNNKGNIEFIKASAGTGKTFTLTERIVELLGNKDNQDKHKYKLSEMMLTTFTREAAADFKRKTRKKLLDKGRIQEAQELELATIGTIDSIAVKFLHRYWYKLGLGANFTELDDKAREEYVKKSLTEIVSEEDINFFNNFYQELDIDKSFEGNGSDSNSKDDIWQNDLKSLIEKIQCYNLSDEEIEKSHRYSLDMIEPLFPNNYTSQDIEQLRVDFLSFIDRYIRYCEDRIKTEEITVETSTRKDKRNSASKRIESYKNSIPTFEPWKDIFGKPVTVDTVHLVLSDSQKEHKKILFSPIIRGDKLETNNPDLYNERNLFKNRFEELLCSNIIKDEVVKYIDRIFTLGKKWQKSFIEYKQENNLVDFSDMERLFIKLLKNKDVQEELKEEIKVVMVDEFQDSNAVQIEIYNLLADIAEKNIWVGDPKQAIYRFRGTDTKTTQELANLYTTQDKNSLRMTWRSVAPLVDFSNEIFSRSFANDMKQDDIKLKYNEDENHPKLHNYQKPVSDDVIVWDVKPDKDGNTIKVSSAQKLANRIFGILANGGKDEQLGDNIKPSDIMILCRNNSEIDNLVSAFKEFGLPVSSSIPDVSDYMEVQLLLSILKLFVNCLDTKAKVEILHLLHNRQMEDLLNSLINKRECQCTKRDEKLEELKRVEKEPTEEDKRLPEVTECQWTEDTKVLEELTLLKDKLKGLSVPQIITGIVTRLDLLRIVAKWDDGAVRKENLIAVISRAENYESLCLTKGEGSTLKGFLDFLDECGEIPGAPMSQNSIRIMSYHGCKGLESRIVILNDLEKDELADNTLTGHFLFGTEKVFKNVQEKENLVHFCPRFLKAPSSNFSKVQLELIKTLDEFQAYNKETRNDINKLLYVGVTRAAEKLILLKKKTEEPFAWIKNIDPKTHGEDYNNITDQLDILTYITQSTDEAKKTEFTVPSAIGVPEMFRVRKLAKHNEEQEKILKYVSPSSATEADVDLTLLNEPKVIESSGKRISINSHDVEMDVIGTCIHNIFAVWNPEGERGDEIQKAENIIAGNGLSEAIPHAEEIIKAAEYIHELLSKTYGKGKMLRELPFRIKRNGRVFSGEMDLVWETDKGCVLLDYKNFPGTEKQFMDKTNEEHYAGKYLPQLCLYKEALEKAGKTVLATYIYYSAIGAVVKF